MAVFVDDAFVTDYLRAPSSYPAVRVYEHMLAGRSPVLATKDRPKTVPARGMKPYEVVVRIRGAGSQGTALPARNAKERRQVRTGTSFVLSHLPLGDPACDGARHVRDDEVKFLCDVDDHEVGRE